VKSSIVCTVALLLLLSGCAPLQVASTPEEIASHVSPGDQVRLVTRDRSSENYRVLRVEPAALLVEPLAGEDGQDAARSIEFRDIEEVSVERPAEGRFWAGIKNIGLTTVDVVEVLLETAAEVPFAL